MKRAVAIALIVYLFFLAEFVLYNTVGVWGKPELLILAVIFCNLYWGIRYGIWAAVVAGLVRDAFGLQPFGTYLFIYIAAAYLTTYIRKNIYQPGSRFSRAMAAFFVVTGCFVLETVLRLRQHEVRLTEAVFFILIPQLVTTMVAATFVFQGLRNIVVKFKL